MSALAVNSIDGIANVSVIVLCAVGMVYIWWWRRRWLVMERGWRREADEAEDAHREDMARQRERLARQQREVDAAYDRFCRQRAARLRPAQRRMLLRP